MASIALISSTERLRVRVLYDEIPGVPFLWTARRPGFCKVLLVQQAACENRPQPPPVLNYSKAYASAAGMAGRSVLYPSGGEDDETGATTRAR